MTEYPFLNQRTKPNGDPWPLTVAANGKPFDFGPTNCGPTCVAMLVRKAAAVVRSTVGAHPANPQSVRAISGPLTPGSGVSYLRLRKAADHYGLAMQVARTSFAALRRACADGYAAVVLINRGAVPKPYGVGDGERHGHYVVAWHYDPGRDAFLVADPVQSYAKRERWWPREVLKAAAGSTPGYVLTDAPLSAPSTAPVPDEPPDAVPPADLADDAQDDDEAEPTTEDELDAALRKLAAIRAVLDE